MEDIYFCNCGEVATHKCTSCLPRGMLCRECIGFHLSQFVDDSIVPIRLNARQNNMDSCSECLNPSAVYLHILEDQVIPTCKACKRLLRSVDEDSIFVPFK